MQLPSVDYLDFTRQNVAYFGTKTEGGITATLDRPADHFSAFKVAMEMICPDVPILKDNISYAHNSGQGYLQVNCDPIIHPAFKAAKSRILAQGMLDPAPDGLDDTFYIHMIDGHPTLSMFFKDNASPRDAARAEVITLLPGRVMQTTYALNWQYEGSTGPAINRQFFPID